MTRYRVKNNVKALTVFIDADVHAAYIAYLEAKNKKSGATIQKLIQTQLLRVR